LRQLWRIEARGVWFAKFVIGALFGVSKTNQVMVGANPCGRPRQGQVQDLPLPKIIARFNS
jgi:hypothetical protein